MSRKIAWQIASQHLLLVERRERRLAVIVVEQEGAWVAIAFEAQKTGSPVAVFADHAHHVIGEAFTTELRAKAASAKYAKAWLRTPASASACLCPSLEAQH